MPAEFTSSFSLVRAMGTYAITLVIFFAIDLVWLGVVAKNFYRQHIGHLMSAEVNWGAAVLFYLVYIGGIVFFAVKPAFDSGSAARALAHGAAFGFIAYATYDLTNQATMRDWPVLVTVVDLAWGTVLTATVAYLAYQVSSRVLG
ncbi:MAG TPA: DUF2177 family protein [Vicinamibacterales bacterium]|nr:DUF2177 family protein [Vicinamibacterales bacterium]